MIKSIDKYFIERNISKLNKIGNTGFLDGKELNTLKHILNKEHLPFNIYEPFIDSDYKIIYKNNEPNITCFKIITSEVLRHSDIMGAIYNFNIDEEVIGDIVIYNDSYYFLIMDSMKDYFINNFNMVGRYKIKIEESTLPITKREYIDMENIVSSLRIDTVISSVTNLNRTIVSDLITRKEVILNYDVLTNNSYVLKDNDIFSIRKYGKYKYIGVIKKTKKDNFVIGLKKYK